MNSLNLTFNYDYAVAVMKYYAFIKNYRLFLIKFSSFSLDIWRDSYSKDSRDVIGYTQEIGGICSQTKYSVVEWDGFLQIQNIAHELGHRYF